MSARHRACAVTPRRPCRTRKCGPLIERVCRPARPKVGERAGPAERLTVPPLSGAPTGGSQDFSGNFL
ncbi:hypothetical protein XENTR_v10024843 [Xenopus tropicalis]|nr:hypothetical protein XENTR_v10024843 [Xenopus tropicalis]